MTYKDVFELATYESGVRICDVADLDNLEAKLVDNHKNCKNTVGLKEIDEYVLETIEEDAVCADFDEMIVRKALSLGYYPMSMEKMVMTEEELMDFRDRLSNVKKVKGGVYAWRYFMTIRHHLKKMVIDFNEFKFPKKTRRYVRQQFGDYTLTFNKNFDLCAETLIAQYEETWVVPPLLDVLKTIHDNPDDEVSVDSVELWHGDELVAGELGFITHNAYASLCGFHIEDNSGTVQMAALGTWLKENGFAYWDLGMEMDYKYVYGAICMGRRAQKEYYDRLASSRRTLPKGEIKIKDLIKT